MGCEQHVAEQTVETNSVLSGQSDDEKYLKA